MTITRQKKHRPPARRRPKLNLKQKHFMAYLTDEEERMIKDAAAVERITLSAFFVESALARAKKVLYPPIGN